MINEFLNYSILEKEEDFDVSKINPLFTDIYKNYIEVDKTNLIPFSLYLGSILPYLCRILTLNKVHILNEQGQKIPINCFSFGFIGSGGGKGTIKNALDKAFYFYDFKIKSKANQTKIKLKQDIEADEELSSAQKKQEYRELEKFIPIDMISSATTSGVRNINTHFDKYDSPTGGVFMYQGEFMSLLNSKNQYTDDLFLMMFELFDAGKFGAKGIKEVNYSEIDFLPFSALMMTVPDKLFSGEISNNFYDKLESGFARRSIICYPSNKEIEKLEENNPLKFLHSDPVKYLKLIKKEKPDNSDIERRIQSLLNNSYQHKELKMSESCSNVLSLYKAFCKERVDKIKDTVLKLEMQHRFWKAFKLSGLIHSLDSRLTYDEIALDSLHQAIYIVEFFGFHFKRFIGEKPSMEADIIFNILKENSNKFMSRSEISKNKEFRKISSKYSSVKKVIEDNIDILAEIVDKTDYKLATQSCGNNANGLKYAIVDSGHKVVCINQEEHDLNPEKTSKKYKIIKENKIESSKVFKDKAI